MRPWGTFQNKWQTSSFFVPSDLELRPLTLTLELGRDFCTMHLTAKFHYPMFNHSEVNRVDKQTNWQTNRCRWKHPSRSTVLRWWVNSRIISRATNLVKWNGMTIDRCSVSRNMTTAEMTANLFLLAAAHFAVLDNINWSEHQPSSERMAVWRHWTHLWSYAKLGPVSSEKVGCTWEWQVKPCNPSLNVCHTWPP